MYKLTQTCLLLAALFTTSITVTAADTVPYGDKVTENIVNYHRQTTSIATAGTIKEGGLEELKNHGFKTIIDMRTAWEGTEAERKAAKTLGLEYVNLPVSRAWPEEELFNRFQSLIEDKNNHPIIVHCGSGNRVGMVWAYSRIAQGVDKDIAIEEGRTIGMRPKREEALKKKLNF